jgi:hypothetical protein
MAPFWPLAGQTLAVTCYALTLGRVVQAQQNFEMAWRYAWYEGISFWRSTVASLAGTGEVSADDKLFKATALQLRTACLQGLNFYKTLAYQVQSRYGFVPKGAQVPLDEDAKERAQNDLDTETASMHPPQETDCSGLVQMCLVKMGDLARCVSMSICADVSLDDVTYYSHHRTASTTAAWSLRIQGVVLLSDQHGARYGGYNGHQVSGPPWYIEEVSLTGAAMVWCRQLTS